MYYWRTASHWRTLANTGEHWQTSSSPWLNHSLNHSLHMAIATPPSTIDDRLQHTCASAKIA